MAIQDSSSFLNNIYKNQNKTTRLAVLFSTFGLIVFLLVAFTLPLKNVLFKTFFSKPSSSAATLSAESFSLDTPVVATLNQQFSVRIWVTTDTEPANLFAAKISFPSSLVQVVSINTTGSFIDPSLWATPVDTSFNNATGQIALVGGVSTPGYQTSSGKPALMATIVFRSINPGTGSISFNSGSAIYANSNNADILNATYPSALTINPMPTNTPVPTVTPVPTTTPIPPTPTMTPIPPTSTPIPTNTPVPTVTPTPILGDGNGDGVVNLSDLSVLLSNYNKSISNGDNFPPEIDMNHDGVINSIDFQMLVQLLNTDNVL